MDYPEEWNELPRHERRKKIRALKKEGEKKENSFNKIRNVVIGVVVAVSLVFGFKALITKSPEQIEFEQKVEEVSLEGKVEEFEIEGRSHVSAGTNISYKTNPPTSGDHFGQAKGWGVYNREVDDKMALHGLEHGGIWISYKEIDDETKEILKEIGKSNSQSVIVAPRPNNDDKIVIASWGKYMRLESVDKVLIQKYIDTYKNQSPEKLAL